jgi:hypothetical protein
MLKVQIDDKDILVTFGHVKDKKGVIRSTECYIKTKDVIVGQGMSKRYKNDPFDKNFGRKLALRRALEDSFPGDPVELSEKENNERKEIRTVIWLQYFSKLNSGKNDNQMKF